MKRKKVLGDYSTVLKYNSWISFQEWQKKHKKGTLIWRIYNKILYIWYCIGRTITIDPKGSEEYYIIRCYQTADEPGGVFASFRYVIAEICWAMRKGYTPVVDMQNGPQAYLEDDEIGHINAWELFFKQPCNIGLSDVAYRARTIRISSIYGKETETGLLTEEIFKISSKYIRLTDDIENEVLKFFELQRQSGVKRILGVKLRGSDYSRTKPKYHAVQPTVDEAILIIRNKIAEWENDGLQYDAIFLATEDQTIVDGISSSFSNVIVHDTERIGANDTWYDLVKDRKKQGHDYLLDISILSSVLTQ